MSVSSVNLLWQHRFRGLMGVSTHNAADDGTALLIRPDEFERRTYQVLRVHPDGLARETCALSVETIHKFECSADGRLILGMTDDDIYIFRDGKKARFMADRRVTYTDVALAPEPGWFVCSFSDSLFSTHGAAFGDHNARLGWTRDLPVPVNRVITTPNGLVIALGLADGRVIAQDHMRHPLWEHPQEEAISALAIAANGSRLLAGTEDGSLLAYDHEGGLHWRSPVGLPIVCLATDAQAQWAAAGVSNGESHSLVCLDPEGAPTWEYLLDARPTGISLSPNGRFLLVSLANGLALQFQVDFAAGAAGEGSRRDGDLAAARALRADGDLQQATARLSALLDAQPHDVEIAEEWLAARAELLLEYQAAARSLMDEGNWSAALDALAAAAELDPWNEAVFAARVEARRGAVEAAAEQARTAAASGAGNLAEIEWRRVLALDPAFLDARRELAGVRAEQARTLAALGDERRDMGDLEGAVALWREAERLWPDPELSARLRQAEASQCLAAGIQFYEAGRLPEAVFQLKKTLALAPDLDEARRYLSYAEGQTGDHTIADRFARLE